MSVLTSEDISAANSTGNILISDFKDQNLYRSSYDLTLGEFYFRQTKFQGLIGNSVDARSMWSQPMQLQKLTGDKQGLVMRPGETILCHSHEFVGVKAPYTYVQLPHEDLMILGLQASAGINGDMEGPVRRLRVMLTNTSQNTVALVKGTPIATLVFRKNETALSLSSSSTSISLSYYLEESKRTWKPEMLLLQKSKVVKSQSMSSSTPQSKARLNQKTLNTSSTKDEKDIKLPAPKRNEKGEVIVPKDLQPISTRIAPNDPSLLGPKVYNADEFLNTADTPLR
jgi:deoxycytidine triphosphate deaminase